MRHAKSRQKQHKGRETVVKRVREIVRQKVEGGR